MKTSVLKSIDCITYTLIIIGALNWGLVGFFGFNLVAAIFGQMTVAARVVYAVVGVAALYDLLAIRSMIHRWGVHTHREPAPAHA